MDEPTSALDPMAIRQLRDVVQELAAEGKAVFFSSHLLTEVEKVCHRVIIMRDGHCRPLTDSALSASKSYWKITVRSDPSEGLRLLEAYCKDVHQDGRVLSCSPPENMGITELLMNLEKGGAEIESFFQNKQTLEEIFSKEIGD
jgi:ABC-2 type transport system ATP-binding protein